MRYLLPLAALVSVPAAAQTLCRLIQEVIDYLGESHKEAPVASMNRGGVLALIFAAKDGSSWTMVVKQDDQLCIVADGTDFRPIRWVEPSRRS